MLYDRLYSRLIDVYSSACKQTFAAKSRKMKWNVFKGRIFFFHYEELAPAKQYCKRVLDLGTYMEHRLLPKVANYMEWLSKKLWKKLTFSDHYSFAFVQFVVTAILSIFQIHFFCDLNFLLFLEFYNKTLISGFPSFVLLYLFPNVMIKVT